MTETYPRTSWRLIRSEPLSGARNMALDAAVLAAMERSESQPTLRLYSWDPPCLSLGYSQPFSDIAEDQLEDRGWHVVRRPTGGRAILHTDELTYSVIGPKKDPRLAGSLLDSYRRISLALSQALSSLELPVEIHSGKNPLAHQQPVCFENPSDFEITVDGRKIIGSAQARKKISLLQHGSLPLHGELTRIITVLHYPDPEQRRKAAEILLQKAATLQDVLGRQVSWDEAARAFEAAFSDVLNLDLVEGDFSPAELAEADRLEREQFAHPVWTRGSIESEKN